MIFFPFEGGSNFPFVIHMPETQLIFLVGLAHASVQAHDAKRILNIHSCSIQNALNFNVFFHFLFLTFMIDILLY